MPETGDEKTSDGAQGRAFPYLAATTTVIVPITVAILGYYGKEIAAAQQREIEEAKLRFSYVTMIVDILQKKTDKTDQNIVCWSWRNLSAHSKAPFTDEEIRKLCESNATLPADIQFGPPKSQPISLLPSNIELWQGAKLLDDKVEQIKATVDRMIANKARYEAVVQQTTIPWFMVSILHEFEAAGNFTVHLHNGDPLTERTVRVPAGRPAAGKPPFTWEDSARDAIELYKMKAVDFSDLAKTLDFFERYNGLGYRRRGMPSPFLWACTDRYKSGKFIADGTFSPDVVSQQCGTAAYLLYMKNTGAIP
jgi:lysozyme family protein